MKLCVAVVFFVQCVASLLWLGLPTRTSDDTQGAVLVGPSDTIVLNAVECKGRVQGDLKVVNRGRLPATLIDLRKSCGCLDIDLVLPLELQPGQTKNFSLAFPVPRTGQKKQAYGIELIYNNGNGRALSLPIPVIVNQTEDCTDGSEKEPTPRPIPDLCLESRQRLVNPRRRATAHDRFLPEFS